MVGDGATGPRSGRAPRPSSVRARHRASAAATRAPERRCRASTRPASARDGTRIGDGRRRDRADGCGVSDDRCGRRSGRPSARGPPRPPGSPPGAARRPVGRGVAAACGRRYRVGRGAGARAWGGSSPTIALGWMLRSWFLLPAPSSWRVRMCHGAPDTSDAPSPRRRRPCPSRRTGRGGRPTPGARPSRSTGSGRGSRPCCCRSATRHGPGR